MDRIEVAREPKTLELGLADRDVVLQFRTNVSVVELAEMSLAKSKLANDLKDIGDDEWSRDLLVEKLTAQCQELAGVMLPDSAEEFMTFALDLPVNTLAKISEWVQENITQRPTT